VKRRPTKNLIPADEGEWLRRARAGEDEAFSRLVEAYQATVFNLCYRMLGDAELAEDAAQETFLRAYRSLAGFDMRRPFRTWLLSIAAHHAIDQIRRRRVPILPLEEVLPESSLRDPSPTPEAALVQRQKEQDVQRMLRHLPAADRAAIVLRYWYDLSYEDMAGVLQTSVSGVKSRLHRARKQLAALSPGRARLAAEGTQRVDASAV
jgi:RNA polymerase sigma-70 factor (ECF subfamily)